MLFDVGIGVVEEIKTAVNVGEFADTQAVAGVELRLQIVATGFTNVSELQEIRGSQQDLHILLGNNNYR